MSCHHFSLIIRVKRKRNGSRQWNPFWIPTRSKLGLVCGKPALCGLSRHERSKKSESSSLDGVAIAGSAPSKGCFGTSAPPGCRFGKIKKKDNEMRPIRRTAGLTETTNRAEKGWTFVGLYFVLCQKRCKMAENTEKNATVMNGPIFEPYHLGHWSAQDTKV